MIDSNLLETYKISQETFEVGLDPYPSKEGVVIYETCWLGENDEVLHYIGSHKHTSLQDRYLGSRHSIEDLRRRITIARFSRRILQVTTAADRFDDEEVYIHVAKDKFGRRCVNRCLKPGKQWASGGILWSDKRRQNYKETSTKKYGVDHPFKADEVKAKIKQSFIERYGVEHPLQLEEKRAKQRETCKTKYGTENVSQNSEIKAKKKATYNSHFDVSPFENAMMKSHGVKHNMELESARAKIRTSIQEMREGKRINKGWRRVTATNDTGETFEFVTIIEAAKWLEASGHDALEARQKGCKQLDTSRRYERFAGYIRSLTKMGKKAYGYSWTV